MSLDLVVSELAEQLWSEESFPAANSLQAIAATDTEESSRAWNVLVEALMEGGLDVSLKSSQALAYYGASGGEDRLDEVLQVYRRALESRGEETRFAVVDGLRMILQLDPGATEKVVPVLGEALEHGFGELVEKSEEAGSVAELSRRDVWSDRSLRDVFNTLVEATDHDVEGVKQVIGDDEVAFFIDACFDKGR
ncbi:hypothetical protein [Natrinema sp. H-ect4]|uniref:hypothetical protein n=1 Tax=Natrinema sp. H-ect4 TaxID=3242699 RepID=UPI0035A8627A